MANKDGSALIAGFFQFSHTVAARDGANRGLYYHNLSSHLSVAKSRVDIVFSRSFNPAAEQDLVLTTETQSP